VTKAKSKSVPKGDVISTNPKGGKKRAAGTKVAIKSSSGKPKKKH
jgi:beta-lactam-binding protein with PASTA domain